MLIFNLHTLYITVRSDLVSIHVSMQVIVNAFLYMSIISESFTQEISFSLPPLMEKMDSAYFPIYLNHLIRR